jgi:hypothetical protein
MNGKPGGNLYTSDGSRQAGYVNLAFGRHSWQECKGVDIFNSRVLISFTPHVRTHQSFSRGFQKTGFVFDSIFC